MKRINFLHVLCHFGEGVGVHVASVCVCVALQECRSFLACNNSRCAGLWRAGVCFFF